MYTASGRVLLYEYCTTLEESTLAGEMTTSTLSNRARVTQSSMASIQHDDIVIYVWLSNDDDSTVSTQYSSSPLTIFVR